MWGNITTKKRLYEENKKIWEDNKKYDTDKGYICIAHALSFHLQFNVLLDIYAKGLQEKEKLPIFSFSLGEYAVAFDEGDASFGIEGVHIELDEYTSGNKYEQRKEFYSECVETCFGDKDKILQMTYRDIKCGDAIWDTLLIYSDSFDCTQVSKRNFEYVVNNAFAIIDICYDVFKEHPPKYLILDECARLESLIAGVAVYFGATIVLPRIIMADFPAMIHQQKTSMGGFAQFVNRARTNKGSKAQNKEKFIYALDGEKKGKVTEVPLDPTRKNVFIMLHCFDDSPRMACNHSIYRDYTEWFLDTMQVIGKISDVNWIIRNHPHATGKKQKIFARKIFEQYKTENIYWCEDKIQREQLLDVADVIITYAGDVGVEYWSQGIPTITLTETFYTPYGISHRMKSRDEYIRTLENIGYIQMPDEKSVTKAKELINQVNSLRFSQDKLAKLFSEIRGREMQGIKYDYRQYDLYDYEFIEKYLELLCEVKDSECYLLTNAVDVKIE